MEIIPKNLEILLRPMRISKHDRIALKCCSERGMVQNIIRDYEDHIEEVAAYLSRNGYRDVKIGVFYNGKFQKKHPIPPSTMLKNKSESYLLTITGKSKTGQKSNIIHAMLMVGSKWCFTHGLSRLEKHLAGENAIEPGGYFIKAGTEILILSQIKNSHNKIQTGITPKKELITSHKSCDRQDNSSMVQLSSNKSGELRFVVTYMEKGKMILAQDLLYMFFVLEQGKKLSVEKFKTYLDRRMKTVCDDMYPYVRLFFLVDVKDNIHETYFVSAPPIVEYFIQSKSPYLTKETFAEVTAAHFFPGMENITDKIATTIRLIMEFILITQNIKTPDDINDLGIKSILSPGKRIYHDLTKKFRDHDTQKFYLEPSDKQVKEGYPPVVENINKTTTMRSFADVQKIGINSSSKTPKYETREVHPSHQGKLCPIDTPANETCGLRLHTACGAIFTKKRESDRVLEKLAVYDEDESGIVVNVDMNPSRRISLADARRFRKALKRDIDTFDVSFVMKYRKCDGVDHPLEIDIYNDGNRLASPYYVVRDGRLYIDIKAETEPDIYDADLDVLIETGCIEYIVVNEETPHDFICCMGPKYLESSETTGPKYLESSEAVETSDTSETRSTFTHCEIQPYMQFSAVVNSCPIPNHNPGNRSNHQAAMTKQASSGSDTNWRNRRSKGLKRLLTPCMPLFSTSFFVPLGMNVLPNGFTVMMALQALQKNNEDSYELFDEFASIGGLISNLSTKEIQLNVQSTYGRCDEAIRKIGVERFHSVHCDTGFPIVGKRVKQGDCLFARYIKSQSGVAEDISVYAGQQDEGIIDHYKQIRMGDQNVLLVTIRDDRTQTNGDKIALRFSQKGTIGNIYNRKDGPKIYSGPNKGTIPHLIFNPKSVPSRATGGVPVELLMSKAAALSGRQVNATAYNITKEDILRAQDVLEEHGYARDCTEEFILSTGEIRRMVVGPIYVQALTHHATDKLKICDVNPRIDPASRQPAKGGPSGALRFGNMEEAAIRGHGVSEAHREVFNYASDPFLMHVCATCNIMVEYPNTSENGTKEMMCRLCKTSENVHPVESSYAAVMFQRHMQFTGVTVKMQVEELDPTVYRETY